MSHRIEQDLLGEREVPREALWGIHTLRAVENFPLTGRPAPEGLIRAYGEVKLAAARTNRALRAWPDDAKAAAIEAACAELAEGKLTSHVIVDVLSGGAGTSLNMNVNEVIANRAILLLGGAPGDYSHASPLDDINLHQSTNDTYPTALRVAAIRLLAGLEARLVTLQEAFQVKEKQFAHVVKVGRTEWQDAVLTTLGREMSAYAEAIGRDRWRVYKCSERLRVVNLGGTAVGTGLAAPREYIFRVTEELRRICGLNLARAENLVDATQNADVFVEVSGILKAHAATLIKICSDLRILSSGPEAGLGEIRLPPRQAGSSIMPGKVNPVIPEAVTQAAMKVIGLDAAITLACAGGSLELNAFLPLVADALLESLQLLERADRMLCDECVLGIEADEARCRAHVEASTVIATALLPALGYDAMCRIVMQSRQEGRTIRDLVVGGGLLSEARFAELTSCEAVCRLGGGSRRGQNPGEPGKAGGV
jgi:aspartate ammonia-lyase